MKRRLVAAAVVIALLAAAGVVVVIASNDDDTASTTSTSTTESTTTTKALGPAVDGAAGVGDPYYPEAGNGGYDVVRYDLHLRWDPDAGVLHGETFITATALKRLARFNLDLHGMTVRAVEVDGDPATFERDGDELVLEPAAPIELRAEFFVAVTYDGQPERTGDGTEYFETGWVTDGREAFVVNEPLGAKTFFPSNDHPSDKAHFAFEVTAPAVQTVVANGELQDKKTANGQTTWTFEVPEPMTTYLVQVAIGDFVVEESDDGPVPIRNAFHRSLASQARVDFARTGEMIDFFDDLFGAYPFSTYGVVAVDEPLGFALETQTLSLFGSDIVSGTGDHDGIVAHELAHQWFGNSVSPARWLDVWLNEGFATYAEWLWFEHDFGTTTAEQARNAMTARYDVPPADPGSSELFIPSVYQRGGATLQALREAVGDADFFVILKQWHERNEHTSVTTQEFIALAEELSGESLDALFEKWVFARESPSF